MPLVALLLFVILDKLIEAGRSSATEIPPFPDLVQGQVPGLRLATSKLRQQGGAIFGQATCTFQPLLKVFCPGRNYLVFTSSHPYMIWAILQSNISPALTKTRIAAPIDDSITKVPSKQ